MNKKDKMKNVFLTSLAVALTLYLAPVATALEIVNLYDAFGEPHEGTQKDFGFSALIRDGEHTILFDAGTSADVLQRNAEALGIDLGEVDFAVASHAHADHTGGFDYLLRVNPEVKIYFPNDFFGAGGPLSFNIAGREPAVLKDLPQEQRYFDGETTTANLRTDGRFYKAVEYVSESREVIPGVHLIATRSPNIGYFTRYPGVDLEGMPIVEGEAANFLGLPELSLGISTEEGTVLVVGCSHSTVEVIVKTAKEVTSNEVALLVGGYHLLPYERDVIRGIGERLMKSGVARVAPAHCTGHLGFKVLSDMYGDRYQFFGLGTTLKH